MSTARTGLLTRTERGIRLGGKLLKGLLLVRFVFPQLKPNEREALVEQWSREVLDVLNIRLVLHGELPPHRVSSIFFVANHISWIDILVLNAVRQVRFVAKAEVQSWPIIGQLARRTGTFFLQRNSPTEVGRLTRSLTSALRRGDCVAVFPEGTTTDGSSLRSFHSGLFEAPVLAGSLTWPITLRYVDSHGNPDTSLSFVGDESLVASIINLLKRATITVHIHFAVPFESSEGSRQDLCLKSHRAIEACLFDAPLLLDRGKDGWKPSADDSYPTVPAA